jgi:hypothetical protein
MQEPSAGTRKAKVLLRNAKMIFRKFFLIYKNAKILLDQSLVASLEMADWWELPGFKAADGTPDPRRYRYVV